MGVELRGQALALLWAVALGLAIGLCYDLLRPIRYWAGRVLGALLDVLFCLLAGGGAFLYAMGADNGRLGLWELGAMLLGFLFYLHFPSRLLLPIFSALADLCLKIMASCKKILDKCVFSLKRFFQNVRKCFILKK